MIRPTFALLLLFADCGGYPMPEDRPEPELRRLPSERLPERSYTRISEITDVGLCAIDSAGVIVCSPTAADGAIPAFSPVPWTVLDLPIVYWEFAAPSGLPFVRVLATDYVCGVDSAGALFCSAYPLSSLGAPNLQGLDGGGPWAEIAGARASIFAVSVEGVARAIWGVSGELLSPPQPIKTAVAAVDLRGSDLLLLHVDGHLEVLNFAGGATWLSSHLPTDGGYTAARIDYHHACASRPGAALWCRPQPDYQGSIDDLGFPPDYVGDVFALMVQGTCHAGSPGVVCRGRWVNPATPPTEGNFVQLVVVPDLGCGLRDDGAVVCWPNLSYDWVSEL